MVSYMDARESNSRNQINQNFVSNNSSRYIPITGSPHERVLAKSSCSTFVADVCSKMRNFLNSHDKTFTKDSPRYFFPTHRNTDKINATLESFLTNLRSELLQNSNFRKRVNTNVPLGFNQFLKEADGNVLIHTDKTNRIIPMSIEQYKSKFESVLADYSVLEDKSWKSDIFEDLGSFIDEHSGVLSKKKLRCLAYSIKQRQLNYTPLRGILKDHKHEDFDKQPMRPLSCNINSPIEPYCKLLKSELDYLFPLKSNMIRDADLFVQHLEALKKMGVFSKEFTILTMDISSLYPSLKLEITQPLLVQEAEKSIARNNLNYSTERLKMFKDLIKLCRTHEYYRHPFHPDIMIVNKNGGIGMGSPDGAEYADSVVNIILEDIKSHFDRDFLVYCKSYRDDGKLIIRSVDEDKIRNLKEIIESTFSKYGLKLNFEQCLDSVHGGKIEFLDLQYWFSEGDLHYEVFRKPMSRQIFIEKSSAHYYKHLLNVHKSEICRIARRSSSFDHFKNGLFPLLEKLGDRIVDEDINESAFERLKVEQFNNNKNERFDFEPDEQSTGMIASFLGMITRSRSKKTVSPAKAPVSRLKLSSKKQLHLTLPFSPYIKSTGKVFWTLFEQTLMRDETCRKIFKNRVRISYSNVHPNLLSLVVGRNRRVLEVAGNIFSPETKVHSSKCGCNKTRLNNPIFGKLHSDRKCDTRNVIYRYQCSDCRYNYIGSTSQQLKVRITQHAAKSSSVARHRKQHQNGCFEIMHEVPNSKVGGLKCVLCALESVEQLNHRFSTKLENATFGCPHNRQMKADILPNVLKLLNVFKRHINYDEYGDEGNLGLGGDD